MTKQQISNRAKLALALSLLGSFAATSIAAEPVSSTTSNSQLQSGASVSLAEDEDGTEEETEEVVGNTEETSGTQVPRQPISNPPKDPAVSVEEPQPAPPSPTPTEETVPVQNPTANEPNEPQNPPAEEPAGQQPPVPAENPEEQQDPVDPEQTTPSNSGSTPEQEEPVQDKPKNPVVPADELQQGNDPNAQGTKTEQNGQPVPKENTEENAGEKNSANGGEQQNQSSQQGSQTSTQLGSQTSSQPESQPKQPAEEPTFFNLDRSSNTVTATPEAATAALYTLASDSALAGNLYGLDLTTTPAAASNPAVKKSLEYRASGTIYSNLRTLATSTFRGAVLDLGRLTHSFLVKGGFDRVYADYKYRDQVWTAPDSSSQGTLKLHQGELGFYGQKGKVNYGLSGTFFAGTYNEFIAKGRLVGAPADKDINLGTADVKNYAVTALLSSAYKDGYFGGSLSYGFGQLGVKRTVVGEYDLGATVNSHALAVDFTGAYRVWGDKYQGLILRAGTTGLYIYTPEFTEAAAQGSERYGFATQADHNFNAWARMGGQLDLKWAGKGGEADGFDFQADVESRLTTNHYDLALKATHNGKPVHTGNQFVDNLQGTFKLGFTYHFTPKFWVRAGATYSRTSYWQSRDGEVRLTYAF